jgi:hypothetical protein
MIKDADEAPPALFALITTRPSVNVSRSAWVQRETSIERRLSELADTVHGGGARGAAGPLLGDRRAAGSVQVSAPGDAHGTGRTPPRPNVTTSDPRPGSVK